jgi:hypothetical protein
MQRIGAASELGQFIDDGPLSDHFGVVIQNLMKNL